MPGFIGPMELIVFGIVALLIFGPKKLPEMGRSLGKGLREFKDSVSNGDDAKQSPEVVEGLAALQSNDAPEDPFASTVNAKPSDVTTPVAR